VKVIVDTSIWSLALRRRQEISCVESQKLKELINESRAQIIGPVRQELLNGLKSTDQFLLLKTHLRAFKDLEIQSEDYELASEFFNLTRNSGIQGSNTDFLICAISARYNYPIFTNDKDFIHFQRVIPIDLY